jgi:hypothetical protein
MINFTNLNDDNCTKSFEDLSAGDVFESMRDEQIMIKVATGEETGIYNAVNLTNGIPYCLASCDAVRTITINAEWYYDNV